MFEYGDVVLSIDNGWIVIIVDKDNEYYYCTRFYQCYVEITSGLKLPIDGKYYKIGDLKGVCIDA